MRIDRLNFFRAANVGSFADGHGVTTAENRDWEDAYRKRWQHDKIVRSTHGVNCTGSCSWKIYVKGGIVTWETQQTDYPRTRPDLPDHEPRGCSRGASYSWYLYSGGRLKYPLVRSRLLKLWREARATLTPVAAWAEIVGDPEKRASYTARRGLGGFVRSHWDEVTEIVAAANAYTIRNYGPDRIFGFSPIPAMSMVSYAAGLALSLPPRRGVHVVLRLVLRPPAVEPPDLGRADRRPRVGRLVQLELPHPVGVERAADPHPGRPLFHRGALQGGEVGSDLPRLFRGEQVRRRVARREAGDRRGPRDGVRTRDPARVSPRPAGGVLRRLLPPVHRHADAGATRRAGRALRAGTASPRLRPRGGGRGVQQPEWKPLAIDDGTGSVVVPRGSIGFRWGEKGKWNLEPRDGEGREVTLRMSLVDDRDEVLAVGFPYFGNLEHAHFAATDHPSVLVRNVPAKRLRLADGDALVATVYDLLLANYGLDRGLGGAHVAESYDDMEPYTRPGRRRSPVSRGIGSRPSPGGSPATRRRPMAAPW